DTTPMWLADSKHLIFMRTPGLPFGQQAQPGTGGLGDPNGPALAAAQAGQAGGRGRGQGNGPAAPVNTSPGLMTATFKGGYTLAFYKADATTGEAREAWHNQPHDALVASPANI